MSAYVPLLTEAMLVHARAGLFDAGAVLTRDSRGMRGWVGRCGICQHRGKLYGGRDVCVQCWWSTGG